MQGFLYRISEHPRYAKVYNWGKLITITGGGQVIVQLTGLLCGIIIIRLLPTREYAYYTLANTMLGTMTVLADGGISSGVMAQGGKVWQDKEKLGVILNTGLHLRRKFAKGGLLVSIPILIYLLLHQNANWLTVMSIVLALIPAFLSALSDSLLEIPLKLNQSILPLQRNQVLVSILRLVLSGLSLIVFPWTFIALLCNGIPRLIGNMRLRKITSGLASERQSPDAVVKALILKNVKRILPGAIYYCLSGQITIWLISVLGNTTSVAQIGALGRLSMMLNLVTVLFAQLVIPRFARMENAAGKLMKRFLQIQGFLILLTVVILSFTYAFPSQILWVLGKSYLGLNVELVLSILGSCISLIAGISFSIFTSRGWAIRPHFSIILNVASIITGVLLFNLATVKGVLVFNVFIASVQYLINNIYCLIKIARQNLRRDRLIIRQQ